jgi:hypothetical protein
MRFLIVILIVAAIGAVIYRDRIKAALKKISSTADKASTTLDDKASQIEQAKAKVYEALQELKNVAGGDRPIADSVSSIGSKLNEAQNEVNKIFTTSPAAEAAGWPTWAPSPVNTSPMQRIYPTPEPIINDYRMQIDMAAPYEGLNILKPQISPLIQEV